jgi:hypothetical protein
MKVFICSLLSLFFLASCTTDIKDIKENRSDYLGKEVTIKGTVLSTVPFTKIYEVKDETGSLYVNTPNELPDKDGAYKIRGVIKEKKLGVGGLNLINELYLEESSRD